MSILTSEFNYNTAKLELESVNISKFLVHLVYFEIFLEITLIPPFSLGVSVAVTSNGTKICGIAYVYIIL